MSIVANYARVSTSQLAEWLAQVDADPHTFVGSFSDAEVVDIDQSWRPMAWLASSTKRLEDEHNWRVMKSSDLRDPALRDSLAEVEKAPVDLPLMAIEGRSEKSLDALDYGMGPPALFEHADVKRLSAALAALHDSELRQALDPTLMDRLQVFPGNWREEADLLDAYVLPNLRKLRAFYAAAEAAGQSVVVWYT